MKKPRIDRAAFVAAWNKSATMPELAATARCGLATAYRKCREYGLAYRRSYQSEDNVFALRLFTEFRGPAALMELAIKHKVSEATVRQQLRRAVIVKWSGDDAPSLPPPVKTSQIKAYHAIVNEPSFIDHPDALAQMLPSVPRKQVTEYCDRCKASRRRSSKRSS